LPIGARLAFSIDPLALTQPELTTVDRWFRPLSEPVRVGRRLGAAHRPAFFGPAEFPAYALGPGPVGLEWFTALAQPLILPAPRAPWLWPFESARSIEIPSALISEPPPERTFSTSELRTLEPPGGQRIFDV